MTLKPQEPNQELVHNEALKQLLSFCHVKKYPAKTTFIRPGDKGDRLYYIVDGSASVIVEEENGEHEVILAKLNKHEFIGEIGIFMPTETRKVGVITRTGCCLAEISYARFNQLLRNELKDYGVDILLIIGAQVSSRLLYANRNFCDQVFMSVEDRVSRVLHDLCDKPDAVAHPDGVQISITRQEIARMVGCSREMAGRAVKNLQNKKMLTAFGKTIVVLGAQL